MFPAVLDGVRRAARELFANFGPLGSVLSDESNDLFVLLFGERTPVNVRINLIYPAVTATCRCPGKTLDLLATLGCNILPLFPELLDGGGKCLVFGLCPSLPNLPFLCLPSAAGVGLAFG